MMQDAELSFHPLADLFPLLEGVAFRELVEDVRDHGLREPIIIYEGAILDGRNRYRACKAAQVPVRLKDFGTAGDPLAFVASANLHRRHLDAGQRALIAAKILRGRGLKWGIKNATANNLAKILHVGLATVYRAEKVLGRGSARLVEAVQDGKIGVDTAGHMIGVLSPEGQDRVASGDPRKPLERRIFEQRASERPDFEVDVSYKARLLDGRQIGSLLMGELEPLLSLLILNVEIVRRLTYHYANADPTKSVSESFSISQMRRILDQAELSRGSAIANASVRTRKFLTERNGAKLPNETVIEMRSLRRDGKSFREIAAQFGVNKSSAERAIKGVRWRKIPGSEGVILSPKKLSNETIAEMRAMLDAGKSVSEIGRQFGIDRKRARRLLKEESRSESRV